MCVCVCVLLRRKEENYMNPPPHPSPSVNSVRVHRVAAVGVVVGAEGRRQVASVFINRLNRSIRLQTDPTVIYGITKGEKTLGRGLRRSELDRKTPWNTYRIDGLPPTPIANPGRASIEAVLNPEDTNFLFFVANGTGGHIFAETLNQHNANVKKWRAIEAGKAKK